MDEDTWAASEEYFGRFGVRPPVPVGIAEREMARVWREAVAAGAPLGEDFDWWKDLPEGAVT